MENYDLDNFEPAAKIIVIGVGGGGNNAVNRMIQDDIQNVTFWVANTDKQALSTSKSPNRLILGNEITGGLGAGGEPSIGEKAAEASEDDIREIVKDANMVFVAAGMGGGTGTGAAPVVARIAKEAGALVVAIVTRPFTFEGQKRKVNSINGLNKLRDNVDCILVVSNDKLLITAGNAPINEAFNEADRVLSQSVKTVVNLILLPAIINLDFADVKATLQNSGVGMIGFGVGTGTNRAKDAASSAINSPLLETSINGARKAIVAVTCGPQVSLFDAQDAVNSLINATGHDMDIKFGVEINPQLNDEILVSVIAADFEEEFSFEDTAGTVQPTRPTMESLFNTDSMASKVNTQKDTEESEDDILPDFLKD